MTRQQLWKQIGTRLNGPYALDDARQIVEHVCSCSHAELLANPNTPVSRREQWRAKRMAAKRARGVPMAYLLKLRSFYGRVFFVNRHTLIPRPETETLVEEALAISTPDLIIDVGTGSGAIGVTLALEQNAPVIATDISRSALRAAKRNAHRLGANVKFFHSDLMDHPRVRATMNQARSIVVVANLPYLTPAFLQDSPNEVTKHEPMLALVADDKDGLCLYRRLLKQLTAYNKSLSILMEIDPRQLKAARSLAYKQFPHAKVHTTLDLSRQPRVIQIDAPSQA